MWLGWETEPNRTLPECQHNRILVRLARADMSDKRSYLEPRLRNNQPRSTTKQHLVFFTEQIAYPHDGIDLFLSESRQQIPPN